MARRKKQVGSVFVNGDVFSELFNPGKRLVKKESHKNSLDPLKMQTVSECSV